MINAQLQLFFWQEELGHKSPILSMSSLCCVCSFLLLLIFAHWPLKMALGHERSWKHQSNFVPKTCTKMSNGRANFQFVARRDQWKREQEVADISILSCNNFFLFKLFDLDVVFLYLFLMITFFDRFFFCPACHCFVVFFHTINFFLLSASWR